MSRPITLVLGNRGLYRGGIDLSQLGITAAELLAALRLAVQRDRSDLSSEPQIARGSSPRTFLTSATPFALGRIEYDPLIDAAEQLDVRVDIVVDKYGVILSGSLNSLLYDSTHSPWQDSEPSLAMRAIALLVTQKRVLHANPWDTRMLRQLARDEELRQLGESIRSIGRAVSTTARALTRLHLYWGVWSWGVALGLAPELIELEPLSLAAPPIHIARRAVKSADDWSFEEAA